MTISAGVFASNGTIIDALLAHETFRGATRVVGSGGSSGSRGGWAVVFGPVVKRSLDLNNFELLSGLEVKGNGHGRTLA